MILRSASPLFRTSHSIIEVIVNIPSSHVRGIQCTSSLASETDYLQCYSLVFTHHVYCTSFCSGRCFGRCLGPHLVWVRPPLACSPALRRRVLLRSDCTLRPLLRQVPHTQVPTLARHTLSFLPSHVHFFAIKHLYIMDNFLKTSFGRFGSSLHSSSLLGCARLHIR